MKTYVYSKGEYMDKYKHQYYYNLVYSPLFILLLDLNDKTIEININIC